jgi:four helix bundle protein
VQRFDQLKVWQRSHALALELYRLTAGFPFQERYGLVSQLRRAATSVSSNIAEGSKRATRQDYARLLNIAEGSLAETASLLLLSRDLGYVARDEAERLILEMEEVSRMLHALRAKVGTFNS